MIYYKQLHDPCKNYFHIVYEREKKQGNVLKEVCPDCKKTERKIK